MRFASREKALIGQPEIILGLHAGAGGTARLVQLMGRGRAFEATLSDLDYDADTAERYGWINRALPDAEYQRCSPAHIAAAATTTDDGRRMSINVETIGGGLMVQHYVEDIGKKDHCRVLSTSDVLTPSGWTKIKVIWELSVKAIDKESCELTNHVIGSSTPEFLHYLAKSGTPFASAKQSLDVSAPAHNAQETPFFAASIEKQALEAKAAAGK